MFGASADGLHRSPHVAIARNQVPARLNKIAGFDLTAAVERLRSPGATIPQHLCPDNVSIAFHDGMGAAKFPRFFGKKSGVNSAENHISATLSRQLSNFVSAQRVRRMNANADGISRLNARRINLKQGFIYKNGIAESSWRSTGKHVLPPRSDDCSPKRHSAWVNQVHVHHVALPVVLNFVVNTRSGNCGVREFECRLAGSARSVPSRPRVYTENQRPPYLSAHTEKATGRTSEITLW